MKRPMRTIALETLFAKRTSRAFVSGGMAGSLVLTEKGWLGHKQTTLHAGEGPIWQVRWRDRLIAWANDVGVKIYDTVAQSRITFVDRVEGSPRADLFKCTLLWQDDSTLLIAWADYIKVARIRARPRAGAASAAPQLVVEITAIFQVDCMIAGIVPHPTPTPTPTPTSSPTSSTTTTKTAPALTSLLILAHTPPDTSFLHGNERTDDRAQQARKVADRPELRIISRAGEELTADALGLKDFGMWGCNDYVLVDVDAGDGDGLVESGSAGAGAGEGEGKWYVVLSPRDIVIVKPRDRRDHVAWLVERKRYEEALEEVEKIQGGGGTLVVRDGETVVDAIEIGQRYIEHLVGEGSFGLFFFSFFLCFFL